MVGEGREHTLVDYLRAWAGFFLGSAAVAVALQANYAVAATHCAASAVPVLSVNLALLLVSTAGGLISYGLSSAAEPRPSPALRVTAGVSAGFAVLMSLVLILHLLAVLIYAGCET